MKRIIILSILATITLSAFSQTIGYGMPAPQRTATTPEAQRQQRINDSLYDAYYNRASLYLQWSANLELAILPVSALGGAASYYLLSNDGNTQTLGYVTAAATGVAVLVMWIVQNRYKYKAGTLLERVKIEQNGVSIRL